MKGRSNYYDKGSHNVICDRCGQKWKRQYCRKEWTGLLVCNTCFDPRHPVTMPIPTAIDSIPVPDARPKPNPVFINIPVDMGVWGEYYIDAQGIRYADVTWGSWNNVWGGQQDLIWNETNFPLR